MLEGFPCIQQPVGSNGCLSTAVRAVLAFQGRSITQRQAAAWCSETPLGSIIDEAITDLEQHAEVEELTGDVESQIIDFVSDPHDPVPVIVTICTEPYYPVDDHAVVVIGIDQPRNTLRFMDPLSGTIEEDDYRRFLQKWKNAGSVAIVIRP